MLHVGGLEECKVRGGSRLQRSHRAFEAERASRIPGGPFQRLGRGHALARAGKRQGEREVIRRRGAGIEVGGDGHRDAGADERAGRRRCLIEVERREGQRDGDDPGLGQRADPGLGDALQVIGRNGSELRRQLPPATSAQLVDVEFGA